MAGYVTIGNFSCNLFRSKIARQIAGKIASCNRYLKALPVAAISPCSDLMHPTQLNHRTEQHRGTPPSLHEQCQQPTEIENTEGLVRRTEPTVLTPFPRRLESLTI